MLEEDFLEAIVKGDSQRVVRLLGQITDTGPIKDGRNALHLAAQYGNSDIVSVLLLSGLFDCNTPDLIGYTALQIAAADGHLEIVKLLIKHGADVNSAVNVHGSSALHEAAWRGFSKTVSELAKAKANLNAKNWDGFAALHLCCQNGHNQSCRELLLAGCDPDVQNNYGDTPLHTSARYGHAGVMRILISAQCRVSDQNKNGDTALHIAAAMNHRKLTRILLESNCDKSIVNKQNETAEDIAARKNLSEILDILKNPNRSKKKIVSKEKAPTKKTVKQDNKSHPKSKKEVIPPATGNDVAIPWSPYGCHYYPDSTEFPEPNLDSLPTEPLQKGEQYYLDLAGNIRKGPVGVGYACYCAPFFHELESRIEKKTKKIKKQIHRAEDAINKRLNTLEYCLNGQYTDKPKSDSCQEHHPLCHTRSFESVLQPNAKERSNSSKETKHEKRKNILYFQEEKKFNKSRASDSSSPCFQKDLSSNCIKYYSSGCLDNNVNVWKNRISAESCESSDEDCEKVDIPCNDSGYSTKMCSNSQGPSPSLSGRLENDGLLSVTPSQEEKHIEEISSFVTTFQNMTIKQASMV